MKLKTIALAAAMCAAAPAFADTVRIDDWVFSPGLPLTVATPGYSGAAGEFKGVLNGNSFLTYCTDLSQTFNWNVTYTDYSVVSGVTAWGATKSLDLDKAISNVTSFGQPVNNVESAVIQAIVWEIIYEKPGNPYDFTSGTFTASSGNSSVQSALNGVNWGALPGTPVTMHVDKLYSPDHQDFLVMTSVPEPGTYALFAAGLAGIGFFARRRTRQA